MKNALKFSLLLSAALCVAVLPSAARADGITGDTVNASYYFPDTNTAYENDGNKVVPFTGTFFGEVNYDVTGSQVIFTFTVDSFFSSAAFNGPVFTDLTESLAGYTVTLDPSSTAGLGYTSADASISGNQLFFNFAGNNLTTDATITYDLRNSATPEPSSLALLGTGLVGAAGMLRRRIAQ